ncbi:hypothetical protein EVAR_85492_1 [Eumeta japonica]|uniref:Uncharacterized protein n=1 Tax=Eumeta variegata TaxID=151549 RepID=A0A4C1VF13_EUMVA|nr:hypothetical protein EVAR_85492_1 [Eumeta japonica]
MNIATCGAAVGTGRYLTGPPIQHPHVFFCTGIVLEDQAYSGTLHSRIWESPSLAGRNVRYLNERTAAAQGCLRLLI